MLFVLDASCGKPYLGQNRIDTRKLRASIRMATVTPFLSGIGSSATANYSRHNLSGYYLLIVTDVVSATVFPAVSLTVSETVKTPVRRKTWLGFARVDEPPSPKVHACVVIVPALSVEWSVNLAVSSLLVSLKLATSGLGTPSWLATALRMTLPRPLAKS